MQAKYVHMPLRKFQPGSAPRSFYLGSIWQQVPKDDIDDLLVHLGFRQFRFWWLDSADVRNKHLGWCWVEFRSEEMADEA